MAMPGKLSPTKPSADTLRREYCDAYQSSPTLALKYGVTCSTLCRWLKAYGIPARSASEAKQLDMARWSREDRLRLTAASRALITGRKRSHEDRTKRAKGVQRKAKLSTYEGALLRALQDHGLHPIPQMAVDIFNIDFAFPKQLLAIELHGGCWHNTPQKKAYDEAKRALLEPLGWRILVIRARRKHWVEEAVSLILAQLPASSPNPRPCEEPME